MTDETGGRYGSPRHPDFAAPENPQSARPYFGPPPGLDNRLVPPGYPPPRIAPQPAYRPDQRPAMITVSVVLIITGSLLWMTALGFIWIFVYVARDSFGYSGAEGAIYHMLERFHLRMVEGLAAVLFGAPTAATVMSFFLLKRAPWPRMVISALGVISIVLAAVLMSDSLIWVLPGGAYIAFACLILWTPSVSRWCSSTASAAAAARADGSMLV